jgi:hypothetical protein
MRLLLTSCSFDRMPDDIASPRSITRFALFCGGCSGVICERSVVGRLYIIAGLFVILLPFMLASFLSDLTRKQAVLIMTLLLSAAGMAMFYNTDTFDDLVWRLRHPPMPTDESLFVSTAARIREDETQYQDGPHLEALRAALCKTPVRVSGWTGRVLNSFDSIIEEGQGAHPQGISAYNNPYFVLG